MGTPRLISDGQKSHSRSKIQEFKGANIALLPLKVPIQGMDVEVNANGVQIYKERISTKQEGSAN
jgi:hypothetical protein